MLSSGHKLKTSLVLNKQGSEVWSFFILMIVVDKII